jgi:hypothetical protein
MIETAASEAVPADPFAAPGSEAVDAAASEAAPVPDAMSAVATTLAAAGAALMIVM